MELRIAHVAVWDGNVFVNWHMYDPNDRVGAIAKYAELGGDLGLPGGSPGTAGRSAPELFFDAFLGRLHAARFDELGEMVAEDWSWRDHRALGWDEERGRDRCVAVMRSLIEGSPGVRVEFDEVLACDERVLAVRIAWRGHGVKAAELEVTACAVFVVKDGQWVSAEFFEADDSSAAIARYEERSADAPSLGDLQSERAFAAYVDAWRAGDPDQLAAVIADDVVMVDRRPTGWPEARGRERYLDALRGQNAAIEIEEVIAAGDRVIALRVSYKSRSADGLRVVLLGQVCVVADGRIARVDFYPPDDRKAMLTRFAQLTGADQYLDDSPLGRLFAAYIRAFADHDLEAFVALHTEDVVVLDHRQLGWPELRGRAMVEEFTRSAFEIAPTARFEVDEFLARDATTAALRGAHRHEGGAGIGPVELRMGYVSTTRDGMIERLEVFDYDDRDAILSRFRELAAASRSVEFGDQPSHRLMAEFRRCFNAHDLDGVTEVLAPDCVQVDHRRLGWETSRGRDVLRALHKTTFAGSEDVRFEVTDVLAADERVIAVRAEFRGTTRRGGGEFVIAYSCVAVVDDDGRWLSNDIYEADDRAAALARFEELSRGRHVIPGDRPIERALDEQHQHFNAHEIRLDTISSAFEWRDHRALSGGDQLGRDQIGDVLRSIFDAAPDVRVEVDVIACDEHVIATRSSYRGMSATDEVGAYEVTNCEVWTEADGELVSVDLYDESDRGAAVARFVELGGGLAKLGDTEPERLWREVAHRFSAHDLDGLIALYVEGTAIIDHRQLAWESAHSDEDWRTRVSGFFTTAWDAIPDLRLEVAEVMAASDRAIALVIDWRGNVPFGGGEFLISVGVVNAVRSGQFVTYDQYEPESRDAILARFAELA